jgi:hypothetical protein
MPSWAASLISRADIRARVSRAERRLVERDLLGEETNCWCCRSGLNRGPLPYQGSALPLSYGSATGPRRIEYEKAPSRAILATGRPRGASWGGSGVATGFRGPRPCLGFLTVPMSSWPNPARTRNGRPGMRVWQRRCAQISSAARPRRGRATAPQPSRVKAKPAVTAAPRKEKNRVRSERIGECSRVLPQ